MADLSPLPLLLVLPAIASAALGWMLVRSSGARVDIARRLAGAHEHRVGELTDTAPLPERPVRVVGRIRCPEPIVTARDDRLVALHRDVDVQLADGTWRTIERIRESRGFELWDHDGSMAVDPAEAAEPLVTIPHVWRGRPDELSDAHHVAAVERLRREGRGPAAARSVTRMVSVVERLLLLGEIQRAADGSVRLAPPAGGYIISTLELDDAMRLLGGAGRGRLLAGAALIAVAVLLAVAATLAWLFVG